MPLHVDIKINERLINTIYIGRMRGGTRPDDVNDYLVVEGDKPLSLEDWHKNGFSYTHRYGDGAETCVLKGLQALGYDSAVPAATVQEHEPTDKTAGGFLNICTCGEPVDDYREHLAEKIGEV